MKYLFFICIPVMSFGQNLSNYRKNYIGSVDNKTLCSQMMSQLEKEKQDPLVLGYLGVYQTIWANHVMSPIAKLNTFTKGKKNIEKAIEKDKENVELRILRYSVQNNAPKFLGYYKNIEEDARIIKKQKQTIKDVTLLKLIESI